MKTLIPLLYTGLFIYLALAALIFIVQRKLLYFPSAQYDHVLATERFEVNGQSINAIVMNPGQKPAILYFGGNGESVLHSIPDLAGALETSTIYAIDYRGYGASSGQPTQTGLYQDATAIFDSVEKRHSNISVIGRSLGTGIATFLAATKPLHKLVLVTPYDSIQHIAQDKLPIYPMAILLLDKYDSLARVNDISAKTLVIVAEKDRVIAMRYSQALIDAFPKSQITVNTIIGAGHNNLSERSQYYDFIQNFMQK